MHVLLKEHILCCQTQCTTNILWNNLGNTNILSLYIKADEWSSRIKKGKGNEYIWREYRKLNKVIQRRIRKIQRKYLKNTNNIK